MTKPNASPEWEPINALDGSDTPLAPSAIEDFSDTLKQLLKMVTSAVEAAGGSFFFASIPAQHITTGWCPAAVPDGISQFSGMVSSRNLSNNPDKSPALLSVTQYPNDNAVLLNIPVFVNDTAIGAISLIFSTETYAGYKYLPLLPKLCAEVGFLAWAGLKKIQNHHHIQQVSDANAAIESTLRRQVTDGTRRIIEQDLATIRRNLETTQALVQSNPQAACNELSTIGRMFDDLTGKAKQFLFDSHPAVLETGGLIPALTQHITHLNQTEKFIIETELAAVEPDKETSAIIFSIVQEALNNISRHAGATDVKIRLSVTDGQLLLHIKDNGVGFNAVATKAAAPNLNFGLSMMKQKANHLGGVLAINSERSGIRRGTIVTLSVPLAPPKT